MWKTKLRGFFNHIFNFQLRQNLIGIASYQKQKRKALTALSYSQIIKIPMGKCCNSKTLNPLFLAVFSDLLLVNSDRKKFVAIKNLLYLLELIKFQNNNYE